MLLATIFQMTFSVTVMLVSLEKTATASVTIVHVSTTATVLYVPKATARTPNCPFTAIVLMTYTDICALIRPTQLEGDAYM
ncbi:hypothetical protein EB796_019939 [Bugula neritina]|uniref:Secreted protein n=1 Tax=Bugula neritina TaxID=10212 RepID=A0A7J7J6G2_BUGNE|nr:hypothetical protein EB796_019939 [Bugula neritina]